MRQVAMEVGASEVEAGDGVIQGVGMGHDEVNPVHVQVWAYVFLGLLHVFLCFVYVQNNLLALFTCIILVPYIHLLFVHGS